jgi:hypothetical protein
VESDGAAHDDQFPGCSGDIYVPSWTNDFVLVRIDRERGFFSPGWIDGRIITRQNALLCN